MERTRKSYTIVEVLSGISVDSNSSNFDILIWEAQPPQLLLFVITLVELENSTPFLALLVDSKIKATKYFHIRRCSTYALHWWL